MRQVQIIGLSVGLLLAATAGAFAAGATTNAASPAGTSPPRTNQQRINNLLNNENRETAALNLLGANGYPAFANFRPDGKNFEATVMRNGKNDTVVVNPDAKTVKVM